MPDDVIAVQPDPGAILAAAIAATLPPQPARNLASALATINVRSHIPIVFKLNPPN